MWHIIVRSTWKILCSIKRALHGIPPIRYPSTPQNQTYRSNPFGFGQLITHIYIVLVGKNECLYQLIRQRIRTN